MKAPFSPYLAGIKAPLKRLVALLSQDYDYVSALATDSVGFALRISHHAKSVRNETMTTERGIVLRVCRNGLYSEYALNGFDPGNLKALPKQDRDRGLRLLKLSELSQAQIALVTGLSTSTVSRA